MCREVLHRPRDRAPDEPVGHGDPDPGGPRTGAVLEHEERGDREEQGPQPADDHRHPDVHAVGVRDPEQAHVGLDEEEVQQEQDDDPAEVSHPPAEAGDPPHGLAGGDLVDRRVVVDPRDLRHDRADTQQHQPDPQERRLGLDDVERGREPGEQPGLDPQVAHRLARAVGVLAEHGREEGDEESRDGGRDGERRRGGVRRPEALARDVDGEDEGRDHRVERLRPPVPHAPGEDPRVRWGPRRRGRWGRRGRGGGGDCGRRHVADRSGVGPPRECATR